MKPHHVDAHTHLSFGERTQEALEQIERLGIRTLAAAVDIPSYEALCAFAERSALITGAFGVHPSRAGDYAHRLDELRPYLERARVIGEIGLCSVWADNPQAQRSVFEYQLEYAARAKKPVNLHTSGEEQEVLALLKKHTPPATLIHWYDGPSDVLGGLLDMGCYFTVSVDIFANPAARELCRRVPLSRLLTETDGPAALEWLGGGFGMPETIVRVAKEAADIRGLTIDDFLRAVEENYLNYLACVHN